MGHKDIVEYMIGKGADIEAENNIGQRALVVSILNRRLDIVDLLLEKEAKINTKTNKPLHAAALIENHELMIRLIKQGADLSEINSTLYDMYATALTFKLGADVYMENDNTENAMVRYEIAAENFERALPLLKEQKKRMTRKAILQSLVKGMMQQSQADVARQSRAMLFGYNKVQTPWPQSSHTYTPSSQKGETQEEMYARMYARKIENAEKSSEYCRRIIKCYETIKTRDALMECAAKE